MAPSPKPLPRQTLSRRAQARAAILPRSAAIVTGAAALYFLAMAAMALL